MLNVEHFLSLGAALLIGAVVGLERGWRMREAAEGERVAGIRTFTLIALAGGVAGILVEPLHFSVVPITLAGVLGLLLLGYRRLTAQSGDFGITTEIAGVVTFLLAVLANLGEPLLAMAGGVVMAVLLGFKPRLHAALRALDGPELRAVLQLALITAVVLPLLPNEGFGPWQVLNPHQLWLMVILISSIGFAGHFAVRLIGADRGILVTGLFAGIASSTALTLTLSKAARHETAYSRLFAAAILLASTTMFPRLLVLVAVVAPKLLDSLWLPVLGITLLGIIGSLWLAFVGAGDDEARSQVQTPMQKPLDLLSALRFGLLLVAVMLAAKALEVYLGDTGIYLVALVSGLTDVDAITLSLGRMSQDDLAAAVASQGILLAALANTAVKWGLCVMIARGRMAAFASAGFGGMMIGGGLWALWNWL